MINIVNFMLHTFCHKKEGRKESKNNMLNPAEEFFGITKRKVQSHYFCLI